MIIGIFSTDCLCQITDNSEKHLLWIVNLVQCQCYVNEIFRWHPFVNKASFVETWPKRDISSRLGHMIRYQTTYNVYKDIKFATTYSNRIVLLEATTYVNCTLHFGILHYLEGRWFFSYVVNTITGAQNVGNDGGVSRINLRSQFFLWYGFH